MFDGDQSTALGARRSLPVSERQWQRGHSVGVIQHIVLNLLHHKTA